MTSRVIDLFCGVGGMTHGFILEGFDVVAGVDLDETCQHAYTANNKAEFHLKNVCELEASTVEDWYGDADVRILIGCAPCQPYSKYTNPTEDSADDSVEVSTEDSPNSPIKGSAKESTDDPILAFARIIEETLPDVVSMENVPELLRFPVYETFTERLEQAGYHVSATIVYCPDYGIPQMRTRLVLLASRLGPIELLPATHTPDKYRTVKETIGDMPSIEDGKADPSDPLHRSSKLSPINKERIKASKPGGTWKDWPERLKLACHKGEKGRTYRAIYGRMEWDKPAPTMTTHCYGLGNGRFGHPEQNRAISLREASLFQTFPGDYSFVPADTPVPVRAVARQIGNAVPVKLGQIIAQSIDKHIANHYHERADGGFNERTKGYTRGQVVHLESAVGSS